MALKEPKPSRDLEKYLVPGERVMIVLHEHWVTLVNPGAVVAVIMILTGWLFVAAGDGGAALRSIILLVWLGVAGYVAWTLTDWRRDSFVVTDKRLLNVHGIVTRKVDMMPLSKVTDMNYAQTPLGMLLGYGQFRLESAGQWQAINLIHYVPHSTDVYQRIMSELFKPPARRATDVRPPPGSGSQLPVVEPDDVWWRR